MDFDFTNDVIEKILVKRSLTDIRYLKRISEIFDKRWISENKALCAIETISIMLFKKFNDIPDNGLIQTVAMKYAEKNDIDISTINSELLNLSNFEIDVSSKIARTNLDNFVDKKSLYYAIVDNANDIMKTGNVDKCLERFERAKSINRLEDDIGMNYFNQDDMKKHWDFIRNPEATVSTGWYTLDKYTNGGFYKDGRCLVCFMGQAGLGKSLFLSNIAVNFLKQDLSVVVISLEMSKDVYAKRFDAHISSCNINTLNTNYLHAVHAINKFYENHKNANLYIQEYPPRTVRCCDIELYLDNLKNSGHKFDVIVIDYLNLILPNEKTEGLYQSIGSVAEKLRAMSYKYSVPVITATQTNGNGINNDNVGMEHVSESKMIVHTVDGFFGLYRSDDDRANKMISMRILKNRFGGEVGSCIKFKMNTENLTLTDITMGEGEADMNDDDDQSEADSIEDNFSQIEEDLNQN